MAEKLPPPLPPERRPVGQLVAEAIRLYGRGFWAALPLGLPLAVADQIDLHETARGQVAVYWLLTPLFVAAYLRACNLALGARPTRTAALVALLVYLPFPALRAVYILPGLAWFAYAGLAVPAAMAEGTGLRASFARGRRLGSADYVHALGSLAALVIVVGVSANVLAALLHSQSDAALRTAVFLSDLVLSPLLFLGGALLYLDQCARVRVRGGAVARPPAGT